MEIKDEDSYFFIDDSTIIEFDESVFWSVKRRELQRERSVPYDEYEILKNKHGNIGEYLITHRIQKKVFDSIDNSRLYGDVIPSLEKIKKNDITIIGVTDYKLAGFKFSFLCYLDKYLDQIVHINQYREKKEQFFSASEEVLILNVFDHKKTEDWKTKQKEINVVVDRKQISNVMNEEDGTFLINSLCELSDIISSLLALC